ncbi:HDL077Cp [Eremothecium sinecaudum]|uniref:assimilatory sulfite reductase (NADPH) n=1 Tax=Eremothecium sinecaudum TaxID=45286 RepID=A0A0X8HSI6_9SACH|nr:HDL077Cp [Eremothecium sinecaudum]AMD20667.1 HDL077Cp [Eremothecium sinecaudum]
MTSGLPVNPYDKPNDSWDSLTYKRPTSVINSVLNAALDSIFSYKTVSDPDLLDSDLKLPLVRRDSLFFKELEIRNGAGLTALGYHQTKSGLSGIIAPGYALKYFLSTFKTEYESSARFVFNIGALDYDENNGVLTNEHATVLNISASLGIPVIMPLSVWEVSATTQLAVAVAKYGNGIGAMHLFDGAMFSKSIVRFGQSVDLITPEALKLESNVSIDKIIDAFNKNSKIRLSRIDYFGDSTPQTVFVANSTEVDLLSKVIDQYEIAAGLIGVRIPVPFDTDKFLALIPSTVKNIVIIGQALGTSSSCYLKPFVSASLFYAGRRDIKVSEYTFRPDFLWSQQTAAQVIKKYISIPELKKPTKVKDFAFWCLDKTPEFHFADVIAHNLSLERDLAITYRTKFDNISKAGIFYAQLSTYPINERQPISNIGEASVAVVGDPSILSVFNVASSVQSNGTIIIGTGGITLAPFNAEEVDAFKQSLNLPQEIWETIYDKKIRLAFVDYKSISDDSITKDILLSDVLQAVFWKYAYDYRNDQIIESLARISEPSKTVTDDIISHIFVNGIVEIPETSLFITKPEHVAEEQEEQEDIIAETLKHHLLETSFGPNIDPLTIDNDIETRTRSSIAKHLVFEEVYQTSYALRPDLPINNYILKVKENKRITPIEYNRNIFQIEFDISGTGLTYTIGEALGVHAPNNRADVLRFLEFYGLDENEIIAIPAATDPTYVENTTVFNVFSDRLDIFGKPPKKFYESLVEFAKDETDKRRLQDLISPAGASQLKAYQDEEYYTYFDVLELFPSVRPPLSDLIQLISPLKRREYSIASSQKVHTNELHLLVVVVDWIDKRGRKRYGQASKFLADLAVGGELVVSVKPSVMKLPPLTEQPIIMAGLGTGLAPFKAIVEEKAWQKQQGFQIGKIYLFLGSRHKREEYLYGEHWEAYKKAGIITHIGAAFSRDQPEKIYIQDRIREVLDDLRIAMAENEGYFYLCGPTWPVPDITQVLKDIIEADAKIKNIEINLEAAIEDLKESSRYILEVY